MEIKYICGLFLLFIRDGIASYRKHSFLNRKNYANGTILYFDIEKETGSFRELYSQKKVRHANVI